MLNLTCMYMILLIEFGERAGTRTQDRRIKRAFLACLHDFACQCIKSKISNGCNRYYELLTCMMKHDAVQKSGTEYPQKYHQKGWRALVTEMATQGMQVAVLLLFSPFAWR